MSAGVLLLASGTPGHRKIGKHCRVMIHSCNGGNIGDIHNLKNEIEAINNLQDVYINALVNETNLTKRQLKKIIREERHRLIKENYRGTPATDQADTALRQVLQEFIQSGLTAEEALEAVLDWTLQWGSEMEGIVLPLFEE